MSPIVSFVIKNDDVSSACSMDQHLESVLLNLNIALRKAEAIGKQKRKIRKLKRKMALCDAYLALIRSCMPVIRKYHVEPLHVINMFWQVYFTWDNIMLQNLPTVSDFYTWYCDSDNLRA